ncbi:MULTISPECIES: hypothetical protein [unclassified Simplicispira]|uniref:hypothetical protein n=1 Tax=unclassified Simplicispira TaxID=2630407 RepID=UPI001314353E|nr:MULTISPECIES: hypothetical protein [unclassified Simplicispira]
MNTPQVACGAFPLFASLRSRRVNATSAAGRRLHGGRWPGVRQFPSAVGNE